jgi:hypothetical protein
VLVVEIDGVDAEALEAGFIRRTDICRLAANGAKRGIGAMANEGKFGSEKNLVAAIANGFADEDFVVAIAVSVRGVQKIDAKSMVRWMVAMDSSSLRAP